jgi:hypothetical protein
MKLTQCDVCKQVKEPHCWAEAWDNDPHVDVCVDCDVLVNIRLEQRFAELEEKFGATVLLQTAILTMLNHLYENKLEQYKEMFGEEGALMLEGIVKAGAVDKDGD